MISKTLFTICLFLSLAVFFVQVDKRTQREIQKINAQEITDNYGNCFELHKYGNTEFFTDCEEK